MVVEPPTKGQPPNNEQNARPQLVHYSEVQLHKEKDRGRVAIHREKDRVRVAIHGEKDRGRVATHEVKERGRVAIHGEKDEESESGYT